MVRFAESFVTLYKQSNNPTIQQSNNPTIQQSNNPTIQQSNMIQFKNKIYVGSEGRQSLYDATISADNRALIIFVHGYKGYKDWGAWNLLEQFFVDQNFGFIKFNMSHNGGTVDEPIDFSDLEAFGRNCYSYELIDLNIMINESRLLIKEEVGSEIPIYLLGHSRGAGIAILAASNSESVSKVVSLAGISDIEMRFPEGDELEAWRKEEVKYVENSRTHQSMPHFYTLYEDFDLNRETLNIEKACSELNCDFLQIHGDMDVSVSISEGMNLAKWTETDLCIIKGAEHTFGARQPWESDELPEEMLEAANRILEFYLL
jgi:uncharacterized protein